MEHLVDWLNNGGGKLTSVRCNVRAPRNTNKADCYAPSHIRRRAADSEVIDLHIYSLYYPENLVIVI